MPKSMNTVQLGINYSRKIIVPLSSYFRKSYLRKEGDTMYIFRAWITRKDGTKDYAKDHGKRAFRFWVGPGPEPTKKNQ